jgi:GNAT superfamily N-acetyltransferase
MEDIEVMLSFAPQVHDLPVGRRHSKAAHVHLAERYASVLADPARKAVLAVDEETQVLGMAILSVDAAGPLADVPAVRVSHLVVHDRHRRRGAGRALVSAAVTYAEELGVDHLMIGAVPNARESNRFLARLGFAPAVVRRVAAVPVLRRHLATAEATSTGRPVVRRRRVIGLSAPLPTGARRRARHSV